MITPSDKQIFSSIWKFSKPFKRDLSWVFLLIVLVSVLDAVNHYCLSKVFDTASVKSGLGNSVYWLFLAGFAMISKIFFSKWREKIEIQKLDVNVSNFLNSYSISKFFTFSNGQHLNEHSGIKQNIIQTGFGSLRNQMNVFIYNLVPTLSQFVVAIFIFYWINIWMGIGYTLFSLFFGLILVRFHKFLTPQVEQVREVEVSNSRLISELYRYVVLIKNEVAEDKSLGDLDTAQVRYKSSYSQTWLSAIDKLLVIRLSSQLFRFLSILFCVYLIYQDQITMGSIFLVYLWSGNYINAIWSITDLQKGYITDKINIQKYFDLIVTESDVVQDKNPITENLVGDIEFKGVHFAYPKRVDKYEGEKSSDSATSFVLDGISFVIPRGKKVAFVGESGSGKSTIANLIRRSFDPQMGEICVNGNPLKKIDIKKFLKKIGSVDQDIILFDRSLRDNISFGTGRRLSDEELLKVSKLSGIDNFFTKLEFGWDTIIGERGAKLSGGERQRIGIARALAKEPEILIFDEATSALDSKNEKQVSKAIEKSSFGKTSIIITHRLSTALACDKIFVMRLGRILDSGTHIELLERCEYYRELVKNQLNPKSESKIEA